MSNEIFDKALEIEKYFCENRFLKLRQAFDWIIDGFYLAEINKYAVTDAGLLYHMAGHYQCGLCDFKYTPTHDPRELSKYTLGADCARELKKDKQSLLFIYSDKTESIHVVAMSLAEVAFDGDDGIITNISNCVIETKKWPRH